jgi:hypothetical protein
MEAIGHNRVKFDYKTTSILKSLFCCLIICKRKFLRERKSTRQTLFYMKGFDQLDKELDISKIIFTLRRLKIMYKVLLDEHQQHLINLKTTNRVSSDDDDAKNPANYKHTLITEKLVDNVVRKLVTKRLDKTDAKLLRAMGFIDVLKLLNQRIEIEREDEEIKEDDPNHHLQNISIEKRDLESFFPNIE